MAIEVEQLPASVPGLRAVRWTTDELYASMKDAYAIARLERGSVEWASGNRRYRSTPGTLQIKQPGDVHRDIAHDGPITFQIVTLPARAIKDKLSALHHVEPQLAASDERGAAFHRLHDAVSARADRFVLEVVVAEAIDALVATGGARPHYARPVRRAIELLRERFADAITLDELAAHAGLDKFHLCRAFRAQVGMPPYAYLTHLRVMRAKALLEAGFKPSEVASEVGLYDQSQLNRHFRRIVGTTPGHYAHTVRPSSARSPMSPGWRSGLS
ncbi:AraC family transcriptional regulator [Polyangium sp. y55x31]|uniref:helix-turn-helix domain-containing protein n=1 Tax=Polyangium sp. y55x31 TaxID=3042688 RepID=UPI0024822B7A|nr:AraC family transcriptional regulator [Polyangium sp. y55x31]MDI1484635.1 AraC family transcriptional regulator [Polyangium sp. y55x31]